MKGSMNDQFEQMGLFQDALIRFNDQLRGSMRELERRHDHVSPHWQDDMRKEYDRQWEPLSNIMKRYLNRESQAYVEFLHIKLRSLRIYLNG